jgi:hypothetical protein
MTTTIRSPHRLPTLALLAFLASPACDSPTPPADPEPAAAVEACLRSLQDSFGGACGSIPLGDQRFWCVVPRGAEGGLEVRTGPPGDTWIEARFHRAPDASWRMTVRGRFAGTGDHESVWVLEDAAGNTLVWRHPETDLRCHVTAERSRLDVRLTRAGTCLGKMHVQRGAVRAPDAAPSARVDRNGVRRWLVGDSSALHQAIPAAPTWLGRVVRETHVARWFEPL